MRKQFDSKLLAALLIDDAEVPSTERVTTIPSGPKTLPPSPLFQVVLEEERLIQVDRFYQSLDVN